jgi:hypothetical protein
LFVSRPHGTEMRLCLAGVGEERAATSAAKSPRKISSGTRRHPGRDCGDAFLRLAKTCAKLGISCWDYLGERLAIPGNTAVPYLLNSSAKLLP